MKCIGGYESAYSGGWIYDATGLGGAQVGFENKYVEEGVVNSKLLVAGIGNRGGVSQWLFWIWRCEGQVQGGTLPWLLLDRFRGRDCSGRGSVNCAGIFGFCAKVIEEITHRHAMPLAFAARAPA